MVLHPLKWIGPPFYHKCFGNFHLNPLCRVHYIDVVAVAADVVVVGLSGVVLLVTFNFESFKCLSAIFAPF